ncbi:hypothetical protein Scep_005049 [Stephania cephalantha]|uniref:Uncharacterized protein n=1 Tax=Stephania cephalantha TaxID=152367 RepID=A0AAP0KW43_9MAGN
MPARDSDGATMGRIGSDEPVATRRNAEELTSGGGERRAAAPATGERRRGCDAMNDERRGGALSTGRMRDFDDAMELSESIGKRVMVTGYLRYEKVRGWKAGPRPKPREKGRLGSGPLPKLAWELLGIDNLVITILVVVRVAWHRGGEWWDVDDVVEMQLISSRGSPTGLNPLSDHPPGVMAPPR